MATFKVPGQHRGHKSDQKFGHFVTAKCGCSIVPVFVSHKICEKKNESSCCLNQIRNIRSLKEDSESVHEGPSNFNKQEDSDADMPSVTVRRDENGNAYWECKRLYNNCCNLVISNNCKSIVNL